MIIQLTPFCILLIEQTRGHSTSFSSMERSPWGSETPSR